VDASQPADVHGSGRDVDGDDVEPSFLGFEAVTTGSRPEVEDPATHKAESGLFGLGPIAVRGEEDLGRERGAGVTVVPLE